MANYTADKTAYNAAIDNDISTQTGANTIPPEVVGAGYTDLANLLEPYINAINNQAILSGSTVPSSLIGADLDLYYRSQPTYFELYRKEAGTWVPKVNVPFSVTLPEGNLTVQTSIDGLNVTATKGGWVIANTVYQKLTQTGLSVAAADLNFYRHDIIYADTLNNIQYLQGTASASPVTPSLPANTILIDEVVVPSSSSGFDPYLLYGSTIENDTTQSRSDTGALTYDGITIASGTTVNIGACTGYVVDNESIPGESSFIFVNYAGETGKTVTTLGSGIATYVLLSGSGTIVFQNTLPTSAQRKTHIYLSKISHPAGTITVAADEPDFVLSPLAQFRDLFQALNYVNDGVYPSANGANLTVNVSAGNIHGNGINFVNDNTNPNELAVVPSTPATFLPRTRTGAGGSATTTIDVGNYDVAGAVTAIPGGANTSTLKYIFIVPGLGYIVQYGQTAYASLVDAIAAVGKESSHVVYPSLTNNALLIGVLAATKSATALNDTAQAQFFRADKFGQIIGAQAGVSIGTLQSSYNNSLQPQITTTTALGAVQIKRGSAADTDNVFQVLNAAGTANFSVTGNGNTFISGTNAAPSTSGSAINGSTRFAATGVTSTVLDVGVNGTNNFGWIQARDSSNYATNRELRINPNAGVVTIGGFLQVSPPFFTTIGHAQIGSISNAGRVSFSRASDGNAVSYVGYETAAENSIFTVFAGGGGSTVRLMADNVNLSTSSTTRAHISSTGAFFLDTVPATAGAIGTFDDIVRSTSTGELQKRTITLSSAPYILNQSTSPQTATAWIAGGGEALKVGTNTGLSDNAYIGFYPRQATPTTIGGKIGYTGVGGSTLVIDNQISNGIIQFNAGANAGLIMNGTGLTVQLVGSNFKWQTSTAGVVNEISFTNNTAGVIYSGAFYRGTFGTKTLPLVNDLMVRYTGGAYVDTSNAYASTRMQTVATENWINGTNYGSKLEFYTTANGTVTQVKALTIDQDGSLVHGGSRSGTATKWLGVDSTGKVVDAAFVYDYSETYDVPSLAAGAVDVHTVSIPGCSFGDFVIASMSTPLGYYLTLKAYVSSGGSVDVVFHNTGTGTIDLTSATLKIKVIR